MSFNEQKQVIEQQFDKSLVTRRGVFKNLSNSIHELKIYDQVFKFSSRAKLLKFERDLKIKAIQLENSFKKYYIDYNTNFKLYEKYNDLLKSLYISSYKFLKLK